MGGVRSVPAMGVDDVAAVVWAGGRSTSTTAYYAVLVSTGNGRMGVGLRESSSCTSARVDWRLVVWRWYCVAPAESQTHGCRLESWRQGGEGLFSSGKAEHSRCRSACSAIRRVRKGKNPVSIIPSPGELTSLVHSRGAACSLFCLAVWHSGSAVKST